MAVSTIDPNGLNIGQIGGRRNVIINGAMQVAQRGTSFTGLGASDTYTLDRYKFDFNSTSGRLTAEQSTDVPSGFSNSFKLSCTTADTSIGNTERARIIYSFEGQDLASIAKGTSDAKDVTVSFYVKGNAAASYTCEFYDTDNTRQCSKLFNVTTDWTRVELTFPADTTGTFTYDNNTSVQLSFWLMAGSDFTSGTLNSSAFAASVTANRVSSSQTNFFDSTSRTLFITGVQLEVGDVATPFEHRSYREEYLDCLRYYWQVTKSVAYENVINVAAYSTTAAYGTLYYPTPMRASPSFLKSTNSDFVATGYAANNTLDGFSGSERSQYSAQIYGSGTSNFTQGSAYWIRFNGDTPANQYFAFDAEL